MSAMRITRFAVVIYLWAGVAAVPAFGLGENNVLLLYNAASTEGQQIATHYSQIHSDVHLLALQQVALSEEISAQSYLSSIRQPVLGELQRLEGLGASIDCIVTTKGLPLRITNSAGTGFNRYSSLESELAWIDSYETIAQMAKPWTKNPYYYKLRPFDRVRDRIRLTSRLDGFTADDVIAGIDRAQRTVSNRPGYHYVVDDDPDLSYGRMASLRDHVLAFRGLSYTYDDTDAFITDAPSPVVGYVSHGVHGGAGGDYVTNGLTFELAPGGVFHTYESFNAYTFDADGIGQMPQRQGLVAEWIARGGTAGTGNVQEPGTDKKQVTNEDLLFHMLLEGRTWAEAAWSATYQVSYVNTIVGDPLMTLRNWLPGDHDLDGDVDMFDLAAVKVACGATAGEPEYDFWADMDADGDVDFTDLTVAKSNYTGPIGFAGSADGQVAQVPEPGAFSLLILGAVVLIRRRRRQTLPG